jgi:hypothetical protein
MVYNIVSKHGDLLWINRGYLLVLFLSTGCKHVYHLAMLVMSQDNALKLIEIKGL